jgi:hypothetical protein
MMRICAALACFILAGCATATNDDRPRMPDRDFQAKNADGEHLICTEEPVIGTRLPKRRVCRTREEWAVINRQATEEVDRVQRAPLPNTAQDGN